MAATATLRFGEGYHLEPAVFGHKQLAVEWTEADPDHAGRVDPRFWLEQGDGYDSYLCSDKKGPVLFFKVILFQQPQRGVAELHMQFMPTNTQADHERIRAALMAGCPWLEQILVRAGVEQIRFDSRSAGLIAFSTKRLGFTEENGVLSKRLAGEASAMKAAQ